MLSISVSLSDGLPFGWRQEVAIPAPSSLPCSGLQLVAYGISERNAAIRGDIRKMPALPIDKHLSVARSVSYGISESAGCCWSAAIMRPEAEAPLFIADEVGMVLRDPAVVHHLRAARVAH